MSRRAQPYRSKLPRVPGAALSSMLKGRTANGFNPKDIERQTQLLVKAGRRSRRSRPPRPPRSPR